MGLATESRNVKHSTNKSASHSGVLWTLKHILKSTVFWHAVTEQKRQHTLTCTQWRQPHKHSSLPPGWITGRLIMQASDLWCNLVQGGRASHTEEAERPAATFGVLLSSSTNSQHYHEEDKTELERSEQVNNQTRTHLIHYLVGMTIGGAPRLSFFVKNDSNYPVIKSSRASRDADGLIHSETGWISWDFLHKDGFFCRRLDVRLKAGRVWI